MRMGVIGGSGLYALEGLQNVREVRVETPFGDPSDAFVVGELGGVELVFLPRHGRGHRFTPTEVPYRANLFAMRKLGVDWIVSVSAVGSLREEIAPGHVVLVDQFIDRTYKRETTFFGNGLVAHVGFGHHIFGTLQGYLRRSAEAAGATLHVDGTYVCIEGPAFSTRAESELFRSWGASVVGMTNLPEARLAREAGISYATIALATDYDCWHEDHDHVTVDQVVAVMQANVAMAKEIIRGVVPLVAAHEGPAPMVDTLRDAILTHREAIPAEARARLEPLVGRFLE